MYVFQIMHTDLMIMKQILKLLLQMSFHHQRMQEIINIKNIISIQQKYIIKMNFQ